MFHCLVFNANWNTFAFHRLTPWYGRVNLFISWMIDSGLFNFWEDRSVHRSMAWKYGVEPTILHYRTWMEMRAEFKLKGGERVEITERTQTDPLFIEDCSGIFLLCLLMLSLGVIGWVLQTFYHICKLCSYPIRRYLLEWLWFMTKEKQNKLGIRARQDNSQREKLSHDEVEQKEEGPVKHLPEIQVE